MDVTLGARLLIDGAAAGPVLKLAQPISFWGGVDPATGWITQPAHPDFDARVAGTVLVLPGMIGSSSSSAIMLELIGAGLAPAAVVMAEVDAILALGAVAGGELGLVPPPVLQCDVSPFASGQWAVIRPGGEIRLGAKEEPGHDPGRQERRSP